MNPTAVKEAAKSNFPIDHLVGVWWSGGDDDARPAGDGAKDHSALAFHARGLESLNVSATRLKESGLPDFAAPIRVTCSDHSGHHRVYLVIWDGQKWTKGSDWIEPIKDKAIPLVQQDAQSYATSNCGWPRRTEHLR